MKRAILSILLILLLNACATRHWEGAQDDYNQAPARVAIPHNMSDDKVQSIVEYTFERRRWAVTSSTDETVSGELRHRG